MPSASTSNPGCGERQCGPHPETHEDCGTCETPGLLACNDGVCAADCDDAACAAMNYHENTCVSTGECDGTPEGSSTVYGFECSEDRTTCDGVGEGVSCGAMDTDCSLCDLNSEDDGICYGDVCVSPEEAVCQ